MNLSRYPPEHWGLLMSSIISLIFLTPLADYELLLSGKSLCTRYNAYASHPSSLLSCTSPGSQKKKRDTRRAGNGKTPADGHENRAELRA